MTLPTEPVGSIPRPKELIEGMAAFGAGRISADALESLFDGAVRDTLRRFEETGSPVVTDGEQRKPSFATYPIHGATNLALLRRFCRTGNALAAPGQCSRSTGARNLPAHFAD